MRVIFCSDYWNPRAPETTYAGEVNAAKKLGLAYSLLNFEELVEQQNTARVLRRVEAAPNEEIALYRGWMLKPRVYEQLYQALAEKGLRLINTPAAYQHCHYLPEAYPVLAGHTPRSTWLRTTAAVSMDEVMETLRPFGDRPVIVKDFVKSRKHEWYEACYIPSAADRQAVERVVRRFLQLQGEDLNEGLVFREFVAFERLTTHSKSGMPLTKEFRLFVLNGQIVLSAPYWEEGEYGNEVNPPLGTFREVIQQVQSRFFTVDIAKCVDGSWTIVELGDGQVAGLPARADVEALYRALAGSQ